MNIELLVSTAFLAGFFGSTHCFGMCGAIVVLFEGQQSDKNRVTAWAYRGLYNTGRLCFYALLGAIAGVGGAILSSTIGAQYGLQLLRLLAGLLVIAIGLNLLFRWNFTGFLERSGHGLWRRLSPLAKHVLPIATPGRAFGAGLLWGALPCGLVYSAVAIAATGGSAATGALIMSAFWLGTLPALLLAGLSAQRLNHWKSNSALRRLTGAVMILVGILALMPLQMLSGTSGHAHDEHGAYVTPDSTGKWGHS